MKILKTNTRCYPSQGLPGYVEIKVVLVEGKIGDYAAYVGQGATKYVAELGDKLSFEEARCHFPFIEEDKYRI